MARPIRGERYSAIAIAFHWTIALLVIVNLAVGLLHESVPAMRAWMPGHKAIGITVLALTAARIAWRLGHRAPPPPRDIPRWQQQTALATHWALYALLIVMPLSGWLMVSGPEGRRPLTWFGVADIPYLPASTATAEAAHSAHGLFGWAMLALVLLHVAAALRHQLFLRDGVMARMIPSLAHR